MAEISGLLDQQWEALVDSEMQDVVGQDGFWSGANMYKYKYGDT